MTLLHIIIDPLESLLVLLHALLQILLSLLYLLENARIRHLLRLLELLRHLVLNVEDEGILVPNALLILILNQCVRRLIAPDSRKYLLNICLLDAISLLLDDLKFLDQILVVIHCLIEAHFHALGVLHQGLVL